MIERNELEQCVVEEFATGEHSWVARPQVGDERPGALVHVGFRVVHPAADDIQEIGIDAVPVDDVANSVCEPAPPRLDAEVHVHPKAFLVAVIVPIDPVQAERIAVDARGRSIREAREVRQLPVRRIRAKHRHDAETQPLPLFHEPLEPGFSSHARRRLVGRIIPVVAPVPGRDECEHAVGGDLCRDPAQDLEHPGVVVEDVPGEVHAVQRHDELRAPQPVRHVGAGLPAREAIRPLEMRVMRRDRCVERCGVPDAPGRNLNHASVEPAFDFMDQLDAVALLARLEVEPLGAHAIVQ